MTLKSWKYFVPLIVYKSTVNNKTGVFQVIDETVFISCLKPRLYEVINIRGFQKSNPKPSKFIPSAKLVIAWFNDCHLSYLCDNLLGSI